MIHRHLFAPIETPDTDGWARIEDIEDDSAKAEADRAFHNDIAGFAALWTDVCFNPLIYKREVT